MSAPPGSSGYPFAGADGLLLEVGNTPLIRLRDSVTDVVSKSVEIHVKAEWFNPGGSVKSRPALAMVLDAERRGLLKRGMSILDASSGNTGISLAMVCAARGYELTLCLPENANHERKAILRGYGANIVFTDPLEGSDGAIRRAQVLAAEHPELVYVDQYGNDANWKAHYGSTGPEIWHQTSGRVTHFVATVGTSGTLMGTTRFLKEASPDLVSVEVQPDSPFHGLEGLKFMETAIVPPIYRRDVADVHLGAPTEESYEWVRRLARQEGLLVGPSGGAAVWAAVEVAQRLERGVIVAILADSGTRYISEKHIWESS